jgi:hypothetical protein
MGFRAIPTVFAQGYSGSRPSKKTDLTIERKNMLSTKNEIVEPQKAPLRTSSDIDPQAVKEISGALNALLADVFLLYLKPKNFDCHMRGPHFRDYHLLLDDHADQIFAMTDDIVLEPPSGEAIASRSKRGPLSKSSTTQTFEDAVW